MTANHLHPLRQWRKTQGLTEEALGLLLGVHKAAVASWELRRRFPGPAHIAAIERVTSGAVTASDLVAAHQRPSGDRDPAPEAPPPAEVGRNASAGTLPPPSAVETDSSTSKIC